MLFSDLCPIETRHYSYTVNLFFLRIFQKAVSPATALLFSQVVSFSLFAATKKHLKAFISLWTQELLDYCAKAQSLLQYTGVEPALD
jgi:hypothetical protein